MDTAILSGLVENAKIVSYFNVASACIQVYDILITLDEEIRSIWLGTWTPTKILYLLVRYSTIVELGVVLWQQMVPGHWYRGCKIAFELDVWLFTIGLGLGEMVLSIRTWAVWNRDKRLGIFLLVVWPVCWGGGFAISGIVNKSAKFEPSPMAFLRPGCYPTAGSGIMYIAWIILLIYDTMNLVLISIPAYRSYRLGGNSQFVRSVYTDGILYYVCLFVLSALNIAVVVSMPRDLVALLSMMERVLHSVLTCRVVLHIHSMSNRPLFSTDSFSKLSYQSENAINLGGPHAHSWTPRSQQNLQSASKSDMNNANTTRNEATRSVKGMRIVFSQE